MHAPAPRERASSSVEGRRHKASSFGHDPVVGTCGPRTSGASPSVRASLILVLAVVILNGCTATGPSPSPEVSGQASSPSSAGESSGPSEGISSASAIQFVLNDTYTVGDIALVQIENVGDRPYRYRRSVSKHDQYAACPLRYRDGAGREFIIPPGTHCDIVIYGTIKPGETKPLFRWKLDECVRDEWGCVRSKALSPGPYTITGLFKPATSGKRVRAEVSFELLPSQ